jgi:hypothetical protein
MSWIPSWPIWGTGNQPHTRKRTTGGGGDARDGGRRGTRKRRNPEEAPEHLSMAEKRKLVNQIRPISLVNIDQEYRHLHRVAKGEEEYEIRNQSRLGNIVVDYFTYQERLNTVSQRKHVSFYQLWAHRRLWAKKKYVAKFLEMYSSVYSSEPVLWHNLYKLYFNSTNIFKPLLAMEIYRKYRPRAVLDPTMGWGGRLVGACAIDVPRYIGIDNNLALRRPYEKMCDWLRAGDRTVTKMDIRFCSALEVDYSALTYDMVLTSPPYYNVEMYGGKRPYDTKEEWVDEFYRPLFERTWGALQKGGHYCLNVSSDIYSDVCVPILGKCSSKIPLKISVRNENARAEFIYVWDK